DERLHPFRSRSFAGGRGEVSESGLDADEVAALDYFRRDILRLRADLRPFYAPLWPMPVIQVVELVDHLFRKPGPVSFVAARLHDPVHDIQTESGVVESGLEVRERSSGYTADITLLAHCRLDRIGVDSNLIGGLGNGQLGIA